MDRLQPGDYVRLAGREPPFNYPPEWWWQVTEVHDFGFDAIYTGQGLRLRRQGVARRMVTDGPRHRDQPPAGGRDDERTCAS